MKVIIAGSREGFFSSDIFEAVVQSKFKIEEVVSGCARGVDTYGEDWATFHEIPIKKFRAQWDSLGRKAGPLRNIQMGDYADALLALWDGHSTGTKHMIDYMTKLGKPVYIYKR